jgi:hypothetical protein
LPSLPYLAPAKGGVPLAAELGFDSTDRETGYNRRV